MIFLFCHCCWSLLWCNYWRSLMLLNSKSLSHLKVTVQIQLTLHPCDSFLINKRNMTGKNVEPTFLVWKFCGKAQFPQSFWQLPEALRKLCVFTKLPQLEIRWNIGSLRSDYYIILHGVRDLQLITRVRHLNQKLSEKAARWFYGKAISTILLASCLKKY